MDAQRKYAYRFLIYWGLLGIRGVESIGNRPLKLLNPFALRREVQYIRAAGGVADWLHNLAQFSANDFQAFEEERFWADYERMKARYGDPWNYRFVFDQALERKRGEDNP